MTFDQPDQVTRRTVLAGFAGFVAAGGTSVVPKASARTASVPREVVDPRAFGARGDGVTDDALALQRALNSGKRVRLAKRSVYAFGRQLVVPSGGGFVGGGTLRMLTGAGQFDHDDYGKSPMSYAGIVLDRVRDVRIEARVILQPTPAVRTCNAVWVANCAAVELDMEISGFKETRFGIVEWNSNDGGRVTLDVHDCLVNSDTLPTMQVTGLSVDNNRREGRNSTRMRFDVRARNLAFGPAAIKRYGYQTDGVNLQGFGYAGHVGKVVADNVHEPFDCFSDGNVVEVVARNCLFGVKLIHGASDNVVRARVDRFMKYALVYGGSSSPVVTKSVSRNRCYIRASGGGEIGDFGNVAAVGTDGPRARFKPEYNYTEVIASGDGENLDFIVDEEAGSNNLFVFAGSGFARAAYQIQASAGSGSRASVMRAASRSALERGAIPK